MGDGRPTVRVGPGTGDPAELIARALSDLMIVDLVGEGGLRQAAVAGPPGSAGAEAAVVSGYDPAANGVRNRVLATGRPVLTELIDDDHALGDGAEGVGLLDALKAVSLMCVPIPGPSGTVGTLTCIRGEGRPVHGFWDLRCLEGTAAQLALAVPAARTGTRPDAAGAGATGETGDAAGSGEAGDAAEDGAGEFGDAARAGADGTARTGQADGTARAGETDGATRTGQADGAGGTGRTGGAAEAGQAAGTGEGAPARSGERSGVGEE